MASSIATMATRLASALTRLASSPASASQAASLVHRCGLAASAADHHGPAKVNFRNDPMSPSKWKEEQMSLSIRFFGELLIGIPVSGNTPSTSDRTEESNQSGGCKNRRD